MLVENISFLLYSRFLFFNFILLSASAVDEFALFRVLFDVFLLLGHDFVQLCFKICQASFFRSRRVCQSFKLFDFILEI